MESCVSGEDISSYNKRASPAIWHPDEGLCEYLDAHHSGEYLPCTCGIHCVAITNVYFVFFCFCCQWHNLLHPSPSKLSVVRQEDSSVYQSRISLSYNDNLSLLFAICTWNMVARPDIPIAKPRYTPLSLDLPFCLSFNCPRKIAVWGRYRYPSLERILKCCARRSPWRRRTEFSLVQERRLETM